MKGNLMTQHLTVTITDDNYEVVDQYVIQPTAVEQLAAVTFPDQITADLAGKAQDALWEISEMLIFSAHKVLHS